MFEREILERRGGFNRAGGGNLGGAGTGNAAQWRIHVIAGTGSGVDRA